MEYLQHLQELALTYKEQLRQHSVLKQYWNRISIILKGSTARGYADEYSDVDFVLFTDSEAYGLIVSDYVHKGLSQREDGVFLPLGDWDGHYNLDTYEHLAAYFDGDDMVNTWEYTNVQILHDPENRYSCILAEKAVQFQGRIDSLIKKQYLTIQLELDWMRQPLRRADYAAALLYGTAFWQGCCRLLYLLNNQPYPCDKWLFYYLNDLPAHKTALQQANAYYNTFSSLAGLLPGQDLTEYPMYAQGEKLTAALSGILQERYGTAQWIDEWYLYA